MPDASGVCGTLYKVKKEEIFFGGDIWLSLQPQNARTRVRLLKNKRVYLIITKYEKGWHDHVYVITQNYVKISDITEQVLLQTEIRSSPMFSSYIELMAMIHCSSFSLYIIRS